MAHRINGSVRPLSSVRHYGRHRIQKIVHAAQASAAGAQLVAGKIQTENCITVAGQKVAQKIEVVLRTRVSMAGDDAHIARTARFVFEDRYFVILTAEAK
jgi:hypothetical protein